MNFHIFQWNFEPVETATGRQRRCRELGSWRMEASALPWLCARTGKHTCVVTVTCVCGPSPRNYEWNFGDEGEQKFSTPFNRNFAFTSNLIPANCRHCSFQKIVAQVRYHFPSTAQNLGLSSLEIVGVSSFGRGVNCCYGNRFTQSNTFS